MGLTPAAIEACTAQPHFTKQRTIYKGLMIPLAQALFPATGAMGLLLQILGNLLFNMGTLHQFELVLGFIQGQPQIFGP